MKITELHQHFLNSKGVSTDTREDLKDKLFFALKGENFNGNKFVLKAIKEGAKLAITDDVSLENHPQLICVDDVLKCLQSLAKYHRQYLEIPILAITGSNGKTTTKELIAAVLSKKYKVDFTLGNLNNHIGVPLTLLKMDETTEFGVVEMGANHQKEIEFLCEIAQPDFGYVTNFGKAHLEGFGGFEGVIKGKSELYNYLKKENKQIFINTDDEIQVKQSEGGALIKMSNATTSNCQVELISTNPFVEVKFKDVFIKTHLLGSYNLKNITAAICVGKHFEVEEAEIQTAIANYKPDNNRSQIIELESNQFILDAYNANPTSMELAVKNFKGFPAKYKVVLLGDMFEVGTSALKEHQNIVDLLEDLAFDEAYVCGKIFDETEVSKTQKFIDFKKLEKVLKQKKYENTTFLIKGSRGMKMERVLDLFK